MAEIQSRVKERGEVTAVEMGGTRWPKGEVARKDCVVVIRQRRASVPCGKIIGMSVDTEEVEDRVVRVIGWRDR